MKRFRDFCARACRGAPCLLLLIVLGNLHCGSSKSSTTSGDTLVQGDGTTGGDGTSPGDVSGTGDTDVELADTPGGSDTVVEDVDNGGDLGGEDGSADVEGADLSDASIPTDSIQQPLSPGNSSLVPGARIMRSVDNTIELRGRLGFGQMPLNPAVSTDGKLKILHGVRFVP